MPLTEGLGLALGAGASALGSLLGFGSSQSANATNLQIARENNKAQMDLMKAQNAYNTEMWNKQNEYNLPSAQVERLKAAGINPSAVFGNGTVSEAGALTSAPAPTLQQGHVSPYDFDLSGVGNAINAYYQNQLVNAEKAKTKSEQAHTEFLTLQGQKSLQSTLSYLENQAKKEGVLGDIARSQLRYAQDSYFWNLKQLRNDVRAQDNQDRFMQEHTYNMRLQNGLMEVQLAYEPRMNEEKLRQYYLTAKQIRAQIGLIMANTSLTKNQAQTEIQNKIGKIIENGLKGFDFNLKKETLQYSIGVAMEEWATKYRQNRFAGVGPVLAPYHYSFVGDEKPLLPDYSRSSYW